jgi:hypothetical protein
MVAQKLAASWLPVDFRLPAVPQASLGILAFEAAAAMSRLLSLHSSLSEQEVSRLRSDAMRSSGVSYLNSTDQAFLLRLACAELVLSLDAAAAAVARLGLRCGIDFGGVYASLKAGAHDARIDPLVAKGLKVKAKKMERLVAATSRLCSEMEALGELEADERKLTSRGWIRHSGPIPAKLTTDPPTHLLTGGGGGDTFGADSLRQEIKTQLLKVRRLKEESLWSKSYEKAVGLMARAACAVFVRICTVFGHYVPGLPPPMPCTAGDSVQARLSKLLSPRAGKARASSGPITRRERELGAPARVHPPMQQHLSNSCPIIGLRPLSGHKPGVDWRKLLDAPPSTLGGAGLEQQYANVIVSAEELLQMEAEGRQEEANAERAEMYEMLPGKLRAAVRSKLRDWWRDPGPLDAGLADGWKEAVARIMAWLGPMAHHTVQWQAERTMDRTRRFDGGTRVYALQTLRWADKEKAEAAIVEVLVALSCICWYEERRRGSVRHTSVR